MDELEIYRKLGNELWGTAAKIEPIWCVAAYWFMDFNNIYGQKSIEAYKTKLNWVGMIEPLFIKSVANIQQEDFVDILNPTELELDCFKLTYGIPWAFDKRSNKN